MIEARDLTKTYGDTTAVDRVSFQVRPGIITGFLGPNGAGKSTTMRMILGLDRPTAGTALVNGRSFTRSSAPLSEIGALLDGRAVDKGRSARNHLRALAATLGIGRRRVEEVLDIVGLTEVAHQSAGSFSLGMSQRLGIASALIADPGVVMLDEPVNGLDPDGILWIRRLLRSLAAEGRTVFLSSHLMSELELTADHLIVIGRGRILADESMPEFIARAAREVVHVSSPDADRLRHLILDAGGAATATDPSRLTVERLPASEIGDLAAAHSLRLHELTMMRASLEDAFMSLTADAVDYHGGTPSSHPSNEQVPA
jgi:ABC-2 type transport system ATP-binding protein